MARYEDVIGVQEPRARPSHGCSGKDGHQLATRLALALSASLNDARPLGLGFFEVSALRCMLSSTRQTFVLAVISLLSATLLPLSPSPTERRVWPSRARAAASVQYVSAALVSFLQPQTRRVALQVCSLHPFTQLFGRDMSARTPGTSHICRQFPHTLCAYTSFAKQSLLCACNFPISVLIPLGRTQ